VDRERGLARAARPVDRHHRAGRSHRGLDRRDLVQPADEAGDARRQLSRCGRTDDARRGRNRRGAERVEVLLGPQDLQVQPLQQRTRFDAQLADQGPAQLLERRQRLGLPAGPVQGVHAQPDQSLAQRVLGADATQRRQHVHVPAGQDPGVRPVFDRGQAPLGEIGEQRFDDRAEFHAVERRAAPQP
jgi:hypothetical protein